MKTTFKRIITAIAATAMCAVPMVNAMTASADGPIAISTKSSAREIYLEQEIERLAFCSRIGDYKIKDYGEIVGRRSLEYASSVSNSGISRGNSVAGYVTIDWYVEHGGVLPRNPWAARESAAKLNIKY